jgi:hypothetical protein
MKHRYLLSALGIAGALTTSSAFAAEDGVGVDLGLRLGYGIPLGSSREGVSLNDYLKGQIPIWVDAGYRFTPNLSAGLYFSYGFSGLKNCPDGADCSAHDMRVGIEGQYRLMPNESIDPWLGVGVGLEWAGTSVSGGGLSASATISGVEFLSLQGGADFNVADGLGVGPFVSFSLGQYNSYSSDCSAPAGFAAACPGSGDIDQKALHEWLMFGVRGVYGL